jgi:hypothetical protein
MKIERQLSPAQDRKRKIMSKNKRHSHEKSSAPISLGLSTADNLRTGDETLRSNQRDYSSELTQTSRIGWWSYIKQSSHWWSIGLIALFTLGALGAGMKYLEESAQRQKANGKNSPNNQQASLLSSVNPFVEPPLPTATPQLSKEYIYAGSRMLAVEDANASALPPADLAVWRPSTGYWYVLGGQGTTSTQFQWGGADDNPVPGDYDGDGKTDFSVFRKTTGYWYVNNSSNGATTELASFGQSDDEMAQADYDGDGRTDMAVFRPSTGWWYIKRSSDGGTTYQQFGLSTDKPAPADYDGDGKADIAVWRNSDRVFYVLRSSNAQLDQSEVLGQTSTTYLPVSADYDGDGKADFAIRHDADWTIKQSLGGLPQTINWQPVADSALDKSVQNDYDGDGKVDIAVWRPGNGVWYIRQSSHIGQSNELRAAQWGASTDKPVPVFYRR